MLTNNKEYRELKKRVSGFLEIDSRLIHSICNPMKNKKRTYILVKYRKGAVCNSCLLKIVDDEFKRVD